jgi:hypothetical protein
MCTVWVCIVECAMNSSVRLPFGVPAHQQAQHLEFTFGEVDRQARKRRFWGVR